MEEIVLMQMELIDTLQNQLRAKDREIDLAHEAIERVEKERDAMAAELADLDPAEKAFVEVMTIMRANKAERKRLAAELETAAAAYNEEKKRADEEATERLVAVEDITLIKDNLTHYFTSVGLPHAPIRLDNTYLSNIWETLQDWENL